MEDVFEISLMEFDVSELVFLLSIKWYFILNRQEIWFVVIEIEEKKFLVCIKFFSLVSDKGLIRSDRVLIKSD